MKEEKTMTKQEREQAAHKEIEAICQKYQVTIHSTVEPRSYIKALDTEQEHGESTE